MLLACPTCHRPVAFDDAALHAPTGRVAYATCPECHHKAASTAFQREHERQQKAIAKEQARKRRANEKAAWTAQRDREREHKAALRDAKDKAREHRRQEKIEKRKADNAFPLVQIDTDDTTVKVQVSLGRLARFGIGSYADWWRNKTAVAALSHVCVLLAAGWLATAYNPPMPRGMFPPLPELETFFNDAGYFRMATAFVPAVVSGRQAQQLCLVRDANDKAGMIHIFSDIADESRVIAIVSPYTRFSLLEDDPNLTKWIHARWIPQLFRSLTGVSFPPDSALVKDEDENLWRCYRAKRGFMLVFQRWGKEPPKPTVTDYRQVLALDRSFRQ